MNQPVTSSKTKTVDWHKKLKAFYRLTRLDKPIGTLLLLWPTLWALWLAAGGMPSIKNLVIFILGVVVMRAAGCVINDVADRRIDGRVKRTHQRPLATAEVTTKEALGLCVGLCLIALLLVLLTDRFTVYLSFGALALAFTYPFMKRYTHLPQVVLGAAFSWAIPMAFAAERGFLGADAWLLFTATVILTVAYDTFYAMVDRDDDLRIGVKSTAILFGENDRIITAVLQALFIAAMLMVGDHFTLGLAYQVSLLGATLCFGYQQWLIRYREREACFKAFLHNNYVGLIIFIGIVVDLSLSKA